MPKETWDIKKKCVLILNGVRATVHRFHASESTLNTTAAAQYHITTEKQDCKAVIVLSSLQLLMSL